MPRLHARSRLLELGVCYKASCSGHVTHYNWLCNVSKLDSQFSVALQVAEKGCYTNFICNLLRNGVALQAAEKIVSCNSTFSWFTKFLFCLDFLKKESVNKMRIIIRYSCNKPTAKVNNVFKEEIIQEKVCS